MLSALRSGSFVTLPRLLDLEAVAATGKPAPARSVIFLFLEGGPSTLDMWDLKPGSKTAEYIDQVVTRITLPGAIFLTVIALMPVIIGNWMNVPFGFGGTSLLIVVGVGLDTIQQLQQHLLLRKYDGFMKKGRIRFRGRQPTGF